MSPKKSHLHKVLHLKNMQIYTYFHGEILVCTRSRLQGNMHFFRACSSGTLTNIECFEVHISDIVLRDALYQISWFYYRMRFKVSSGHK